MCRTMQPYTELHVLGVHLTVRPDLVIASNICGYVIVLLCHTVQVLGNPSGEVLGKFKRNGAAHVDFNFATQKGIGVAQLIPHASPECVDLITKVCQQQHNRTLAATYCRWNIRSTLPLTRIEERRKGVQYRCRDGISNNSNPLHGAGGGFTVIFFYQRGRLLYAHTDGTLL